MHIFRQCADQTFLYNSRTNHILLNIDLQEFKYVYMHVDPYFDTISKLLNKKQQTNNNNNNKQKTKKKTKNKKQKQKTIHLVPAKAYIKLVLFSR